METTQWWVLHFNSKLLFLKTLLAWVKISIRGRSLLDKLLIMSLILMEVEINCWISLWTVILQCSQLMGITNHLDIMFNLKFLHYWQEDSNRILKIISLIARIMQVITTFTLQLHLLWYLEEEVITFLHHQEIINRSLLHLTSITKQTLSEDK